MSDNKTWVNDGSQSDIPSNESGESRKTVVNDGSSGIQTQVNPNPAGVQKRRRPQCRDDGHVDEPIIDAITGAVINLRPGDRIRSSKGYELTVQSRIGEAKDNGESDVFLCKAGEAECVLKIFRRPMKNVERKIEAFSAVNSEYVAPIHDTGLYADRYFEVYDHYAYGSLANELNRRTFSFDELKDRIIPQLANAINDLHKNGIYHRDIKPGNIMWKDRSKRHIVLIDFGLSSVIHGAPMYSTIVASQVGGTRAYEPPEARNNRITPEYDYFSMGIVLYELFCGKVPDYNGIDRITRPENMPDELYQLILGLTYNDISNRADKNNPNRRWTYDEICKWLKGEKLPSPGTVQVIENKSDPVDERSLPPFSFREKTYKDIDSLCTAMATDWENGRACIMRGSLLQHLRRQGKTNAQALWASQIDDITNNASYNPDQKLLHVIGALSPNHPYIACPLGCFSSPAAFGKRLMACMRNQSSASHNAAADAMKVLLSTNELSTFAKNNNASEDFVKYLQEFEAVSNTDRWNRQKESIVYEIAYCFSGESGLDVGLPDGTIFNTVDDLKQYLIRFGTGNFKDLYSVCEYFLDGAQQLKPQVYGWLRHQGYSVKGFNQ